MEFGHTYPPDKAIHGNLRLFRPLVHEIHDAVPCVMRRPSGLQISPRPFFNATCSSCVFRAIPPPDSDVHISGAATSYSRAILRLGFLGKVCRFPVIGTGR